MAQENKNNKNFNINISDDVATGTYCNLAVITHSPAEIIIDFAQALPGKDSPTVRQRIIMTPHHAKHLLMALSDNLNKFEASYGTIDEPRNINDPIPYDILPQGKA